MLYLNRNQRVNVEYAFGVNFKNIENHVDRNRVYVLGYIFLEINTQLIKKDELLSVSRNPC